jgi:putative transposase
LIEKSKELEMEIIGMEIMSDHVHLLAEIPPVIEVGRLIGRLKGYTSHSLRKEFPELTRKLPCLRTNSYFVSTVGGAPLEIVKHYMEDQKYV